LTQGHERATRPAKARDASIAYQAFFGGFHITGPPPTRGPQRTPVTPATPGWGAARRPHSDVQGRTKGRQDAGGNEVTLGPVAGVEMRLEAARQRPAPSQCGPRRDQAHQSATGTHRARHPEGAARKSGDGGGRRGGGGGPLLRIFNRRRLTLLQPVSSTAWLAAAFALRYLQAEYLCQCVCQLLGWHSAGSFSNAAVHHFNWPFAPQDAARLAGTEPQFRSTHEELATPSPSS
jgi:hypothetical protein